MNTCPQVNISRVVKKKGPYQPGAEPVYGETPERPLVPRRPEEALPLPPFASGPRAPKRGSTAIGLFGSIEDAQELQLGTGDELSSEQRVLSESDDSEDSRRKPPLPPNGGELTTYSPFNKDLL